MSNNLKLTLILCRLTQLFSHFGGAMTSLRHWPISSHHCHSNALHFLAVNQSHWPKVGSLMTIKLIVDYVIGESKCVEKRKVDNRRLTPTIKLIGD